MLLGRASTHADHPTLDGLGVRGDFGGRDDDDSSGVLRFVRIEYAGHTRSASRLAGLTLAGQASAAPDDGFFDPEAAYLGAVRDASDGWTGGGWMVWRER